MRARPLFILSTIDFAIVPIELREHLESSCELVAVSDECRIHPRYAAPDERGKPAETSGIARPRIAGPSGLAFIDAFIVNPADAGGADAANAPSRVAD